jgi:hypothetical protein
MTKYKEPRGLQASAENNALRYIELWKEIKNQLLKLSKNDHSIVSNQAFQTPSSSQLLHIWRVGKKFVAPYFHCQICKTMRSWCFHHETQLMATAHQPFPQLLGQGLPGQAPAVAMLAAAFETLPKGFTATRQLSKVIRQLG